MYLLNCSYNEMTYVQLKANSHLQSSIAYYTIHLPGIWDCKLPEVEGYVAQTCLQLCSQFLFPSLKVTIS